MQNVGRDEVIRLVEGGAQLVEVLPAKEYEAEHLPGAVNIPLRNLAVEAPNQLDRGRPVVVYCFDYQ